MAVTTFPGVLRFYPLLQCLLCGIVALACGAAETKSIPEMTNNYRTMNNTITMDTTYLAGGCFWCIEAVFQRLEGVSSVQSGYMGGSVANPTYEQVCSGSTGHAEVAKIVFDPSVLPFEELLHVFFSAHDPTTLNAQGNDIGTQYRSAIFTTSPQQQQVAMDYIAQLTTKKTWSNPIVTEVTAAPTYYAAEDYHQNYFNQHGSRSYCEFVVRPKVEKFMKDFKNKVKKEYQKQ
jgi:peptide-methionine (S)-S-oxide reductase